MMATENEVMERRLLNAERVRVLDTGTGELKNEAPAQGNGAKKPHQKASPGQIDRVRQLMGELALSEERITKYTCEKWGLGLNEILPEQAEALVKELEKELEKR